MYYVSFIHDINKHSKFTFSKNAQYPLIKFLSSTKTSIEFILTNNKGESAEAQVINMFKDQEKNVICPCELEIIPRKPDNARLFDILFRMLSENCKHSMTWFSSDEREIMWDHLRETNLNSSTQSVTD